MKNCSVPGYYVYWYANIAFHRIQQSKTVGQLIFKQPLFAQKHSGFPAAYSGNKSLADIVEPSAAV